MGRASRTKRERRARRERAVEPEPVVLGTGRLRSRLRRIEAAVAINHLAVRPCLGRCRRSRAVSKDTGLCSVCTERQEKEKSTP